jgi:hypothetical protein
MERSEPVKLASEVLGLGAAAAGGVMAATDSLQVTVIGAVVGFSGLLVRSILVSQRDNAKLIAGYAEAAEVARDGEHYWRWQFDRLMFDSGKSTVDPGPFVPRRPPHQHEAPTDG